MTTITKDELNSVLEGIGIDKNVALQAMHLSEIEQEADNVLDLLTSLRAHAHHQDVVAGQETLAELTIALEHLFHHVQEVLPGLQEQLDLEA